MPVNPRILLINPWIYDFAAANLWARPLGLLQVAEFLSAYTSNLAFIDCLTAYSPSVFGRGKYHKTQVPTPPLLAAIPRRYGRYGIPEADFRALLLNALPVDAILVTGIMTYWYPGVQAVIQICKTLAPRTPVVLGGIYARLFPEHARIHSGADVVYTQRVGEPLIPLLRGLGLELQPQYPPKPYYALNFFPSPLYAPLLTSEGCPYACAYCASSLLYPEFRRKTPAAVLEDIRILQAMGVRDFAFYDDALLVGAKTHLQPILEGVVTAGWPIRFHTPNGLHARLLTPALAHLMYRAHFKTLRLSLETVNPDRQALTGAKVSNPEFESAVGYLRQAGFGKSELGAYLMYGLPGQSWDEVLAGVDFLTQHQVRIALTEYSPLPGTPLWSELVASGTIPGDLDPLLTNNSVYSLLYSGYSPEKIRALKSLLQNR